MSQKGRVFGRCFLRWLSSCAPKPPDNLDRYAVLLRECGTVGDYTRGRQVHEKLVGEGLFGRFLGNVLVEMYGKCGCLEEARGVFDRIRSKNVFSWNIMAGAYVQGGHHRDALRLYREMCVQGIAADEFTILAVVAACAELGSLKYGKSVFESIKGSGILEKLLVRSSVVSMFGKCGSVRDAKSFFDDELALKSIGSWNAMLAAYAQNGFGAEAMLLFRLLQLDGTKADSVTFVSVLDACGILGSIQETRAVHGIARGAGLDCDPIVGNTLVSAYGKCKSCVDSRGVFDELRARNVVSWTAMISAYGQNGYHREAVELFSSMDCEPDVVLLASVLDSCGSLCDLETGTRIHHRHCKKFEATSLEVGNALVKLYARCGAVDSAAGSFARMKARDVQSWSWLISAYAQSDRSGNPLQAMELLFRMVLEGVRPNEFVLTHVLDSCSHLGLVSRGGSLFASMVQDLGVAASVEHYGCVVDLLGRVGDLDRAQQVIEAMPFEADGVMWLILLSACSVHGDAERGSVVASRIEKLEPGTSACFVLVANCIFNF